ncbi:MAG: enoyl-CoA hydratase-related protein [Chloroflexota bacterium]
MSSTIYELARQAEYTILAIDNHVLTITINRPHVLNALHPPAHAELGCIFDAFAHDPDLWVCVITGAGERSFCAGTDLKVRSEMGADEYPPSGYAGLTHRHDLEKPVIAAVNGLAFGGGMEIVLATDIVIAAEHAEFSLPEPIVGLAATGGGGIHRIVRQLPNKLAMGLLLTGRRISAQEAASYGLVNQVVPANQLEATVTQWVNEILACAPLAVRATKQVARRSANYASLADALDADYPAVDVMLNSEDAKEGPLAFVEKRKPDWQGL